MANPVQRNFNGGEVSRRLHGRADLNLYDIGLAEMTGFVALVEGGLEACPGTIRVAAAAGPCRLIPFETVATQGYVIEASHLKARFYTNDTRIEADGEPVELALPYSYADLAALNWEQSYDVLYLFHGAHRTRELVRTGADSFELSDHAFENGPFEDRNKDESLTVSASATQGAVTLEASAPLFAAGDVGGLFQLEADDFGDISSWEPGITVTVGQLLSWNERVYSVVGGSNRTGTVAPVHAKGVEWDGIGKGQDLNTKPAGGVQLQYMHDRFGVVRIDAFTDSTHVTGTVLRTLPFTAATSYGYTGGYYDGDVYVPPDDAVTYNFGTWRWRFGAFSDRRGWPTCGIVWNERLVLFKGASGYASVAGDLNDHSTYNELGDISADMAFRFTLSDPNPVVGCADGEKLVILTASGAWELGASNAASGVGPNNFRIDRQNHEGAAAARPVELDGRTLYIGKSRRRVLEGSYDASRARTDSIDLSRYARHIGAPRYVEIVSQKDPNRLVWACRADGTLAQATYVVEEQVLGWGTRPLGAGIAARSIASITDPAGELNQLWVAAERVDGWHVLRMDQFRQEADAEDPAMTDLSAQYEGAAATTFGPLSWLAGATIDVTATDANGVQAAYLEVTVDGGGMFTIPNPATKVSAGLRFPARITTLPVNADANSGMGRMTRISTTRLNVLKSRGLQIAVQGNPPRSLEQLFADSTTNAGFEPDTGILQIDDAGTDDRYGQVTIERIAPLGATIRAIGYELQSGRA